MPFDTMLSPKQQLATVEHIEASPQRDNRGIFIIGATGHIGGAILDAIVTKYPDLRITALIRGSDRATLLKKRYDNVQMRLGSLSDTGVIEKESRAAHLVINAAPDGLAESSAAIKAALRGLSSRSEHSNGPVHASRGFYVQTSGAYLIGSETNGQSLAGHPEHKIWSDITDISSIISTDPEKYHATTDAIVRSFASTVNVAIISPSVVCGISPSIVAKVPITQRDLIIAARKLGSGFTIGPGENLLGYIHVEDLARMYVALLDEAFSGVESKKELWGPEAYYFASGEEWSFGEYMAAIVKVLRNRDVVQSEDLVVVDADGTNDEHAEIREFAATHGYGANVRCRSDRARRLLGWETRAQKLFETLEEVVELSLGTELK